MLNLQLGFGLNLVWSLSFDLSGLGGPTRSISSRRHNSGSLRHASPLPNVKVTIHKGEYYEWFTSFMII